MVTRRRVVVALGAGALAPLASFAQGKKIHRLGILSGTTTSRRDAAFIQALGELGYIEGKNILIERRYPESGADRLPSYAADLVRLGVDVIFAPNTVAAIAAKQATAAIPIVFAVAPDPVGSGLVASLSRPGANITGTSSIATELSAKRLQILKEAFPKISRVAVFISGERIVNVHLAEVQRAAKALRIDILSTQIQHRAEFEPELAKLRKWRADSVYVIQSSTNFNNRELLVEFAAKTRLPAIFPYEESVELGGLLSYGTSFDALYRRAATYVDKIIRGAKPVDLPVEQPTIFELVVNKKTATALGIKFPNSILVRVTKVIE